MSTREDALSAIYYTAKENHYIMIQDGWHSLNANFDFAYSREVLDTLKAANVKYFVIEMPDFYSKVINDFQKGKISEDVFKEAIHPYWGQQPIEVREKTHANIVDLVLYSKEIGLKVHCLDRHSDYDHLSSLCYEFRSTGINIEIGQIKSMLAEITGELKHNYEGNPYVADILQTQIKGVLRAIDKLGVGDDLNISSPYFDRLVYEISRETRLGKGDEDLADRIKSTTRGEKTAIMFGWAHGGASELDEDLVHNISKNIRSGNPKFIGRFGKNERTTVGKILLTPNSETLERFIGINEVEDDISIKEMPTTIIFTDYSDKPGHQVKLSMLKGTEVGKEVQNANISLKDVGDYSYGEFKVPHLQNTDIPKAIIVNEAGISR